MLELLHQAILPINLVLTILLGICVLYWLSVIVGALDIGSLDIDFEIEADVDVDVDVDADVDADSSGVGAFALVLHFFNFGKLPFMVIFTILILSMWVLTILSNYYIGQGSWTIALLLYFPILFVSLVITKILTAPLLKLFKDFGKGNEAVHYISKQCTILLPPTIDRIGQGEVKLEGTILRINIQLQEDSEPLQAGDQAVIIDEIKDRKLYLVAKI